MAHWTSSCIGRIAWVLHIGDVNEPGVTAAWDGDSHSYATDQAYKDSLRPSYEDE